MQRLNLLPVGEAARSHFNVVEPALFFSRLPHARFACVDHCRQEHGRQQAHRTLSQTVALEQQCAEVDGVRLMHFPPQLDVTPER